jgi:iron(III) transport system substrate-binding protein
VKVYLRFPVIFLTLWVCGCKHPVATTPRPVVLYTSVDEPFARPLVDEFQKRTGISVTLLTDAEASKSVGLAERLRAEKQNPQADVWWDNECFLTINLADEGVVSAYDSPSAKDIPARYRDSGRRWAASIYRVRTMVSAPDKVAFAPKRLRDLIDPRLKGHIALARPTAGTTGGHVAALYVLWGDDKATKFFRDLRANDAKLLGGNSAVAETVARGDLWAGVCDNDDAASAVADVGNLTATLPDQGEHEDGTLAIPCCVALVSGAPHPDAGKMLIDFLLSSEVDRKLIDGKFAQGSTREVGGTGKFMQVDLPTVAHAMPAAIRKATAILDGRDEK